VSHTATRVDRLHWRNPTHPAADEEDLHYVDATPIDPEMSAEWTTGASEYDDTNYGIRVRATSLREAHGDGRGQSVLACRRHNLVDQQLAVRDVEELCMYSRHTLAANQSASEPQQYRSLPTPKHCRHRKG
jgi:hypothetical protein